jgi:hypothetical protein
MKKLAIAIVIALIALAVVAGPALAWGSVDAEVTCNEITAEKDGTVVEDFVVGDTIYFYGSVTVVAHAANYDGGCYYNGCHVGTYAEVNACVKYIIKDPDGNVLDVGYVPLSGTNYDQGTGHQASEVCVDGVAIPWESDPIFIEMVGDYTAKQKGCVEAVYGYWDQDPIYEWVNHPYYWHGKWYDHWKYDLVGWEDPEFHELDSDHDCCRSSQTFSAHSAVVASMSYSHPFLVIELPDGSKHFFGSDGWGDPTSQDIVYTDGTWQVVVSGGTVIQMDGSWHQTTYLDVDDQGNVTGRYGAGGSTTAEEIGLSQPITITKVG